jgi:cbb3-type cytochrome oxidase subunit 3
MSLSDIMGNLRLDAYAEVGLVLFLIAFAAIAANVLSRSRESTARSAAMPLADDADEPARPDAGDDR